MIPQRYIEELKEHALYTEHAHYLENMNQSEGKAPTQKQFVLNMEEKMKDPEFLNDIHIILRPGIEYDNEAAYAFVKSEILEKI